MKTEILTLIHQEFDVDEYGDKVVTKTKRDVFCELCSVGGKEFYQAQAVGLLPEIKFKLADYLDYQGELYVVHNGTRYSVIRTYRDGLELELVCTREVNRGNS